ncbi:ATP-dependent Clp protease ATP-binding subunit [uncultured Flavobacterium sp.]|uniref:AAA family ATPase n=1 Tax=uncultured Flavobacterium sp. TaxID=165435 RepID=UPI0025FBD8DB|nr:ATP-dependent Clp protease ATP-binding subunit [uncultured Flavobacterium sp.]
MNTNEITYTQELQKAIEIAQLIAKENSNKSYSSAHFLKAILNRDFSLLKQLESMGIDVFFLLEWADVRIEEMPKSSQVFSPVPDEAIDKIIDEADAVRILNGLNEIDLLCVMTAISTPGVGFNFDQLKAFPVSRNELLDEKIDADAPFPNQNGQLKTTKNTFLSKYCINKSKELKKSTEKFAVAREFEINSIIDTLCRLSKPNVLLIGDHGVGKTALINGFVQNINNNQVPNLLQDTKVYEIDLSTLIAGASYKGEIEDRLKNIFQEVRMQSKSIIIIEEIHTLLDKQGNDSGASNIIKGELAKGLTIIATSTIEEYTKRIEKDQGLSSMFEIRKIYEAPDEDNFRMVKLNVERLKNHHKIMVSEDTLWESIRLSKRYLKENSLPESAINLIDYTMSVLKTAGETFLKEKENLNERVKILAENKEKVSEKELFAESKWLLNDLLQKTSYLNTLAEQKEKNESLVFNNSEDVLNHVLQLIEKLQKIALEKRTNIEPLDLALIVASKTGIPIGKLQEEEKQRLNQMEAMLQERVVGQNHAIEIVSEAILESRSGLSKAGQPIGSFFFLGPTGTGKTELAKSLASFLFQDENAIIRFDMSEFKEEHSAALLYGAPPGYVGYEEGGLLVNKIRQKPYSIVLFDEIEKAHSSVFDVFLQIMDEGKLHDRLGKEGDFSNSIVLFTSNIGADFIVDSFSKSIIPQSNQLLEIMTGHFRPEFLGRITEIIPFAPISKENAIKILEVHVKKEFTDLANNLNIKVNIAQEVKEYLADNGYNIKYGARPLKGIIRNELRRPLAKKLIADEFKEGDEINIILNNQKIEWLKSTKSDQKKA